MIIDVSITVLVRRVVLVNVLMVVPVVARIFVNGVTSKVSVRACVVVVVMMRKSFFPLTSIIKIFVHVKDIIYHDIPLVVVFDDVIMRLSVGKIDNVIDIPSVVDDIDSGAVK